MSVKLGAVAVLLFYQCFAQEDYHIIKFNSIISPKAHPDVVKAAKKAIKTKQVEATWDKVTHGISFGAPYRSAAKPTGTKLLLSGNKEEGKNPTLHLLASYDGNDWAFIEDAVFRIGTNVLTFHDPNPSEEVISGDEVHEAISWTVNTADSQMLVRSIIAGARIDARLEGRKTNLRLTISNQDRVDFANVLNVYFAVGGEPLSMKRE